MCIRDSLCGASNGTVSTAIVTQIVSYAESDANSILGPGFTVPQATAAVQTIVKRCTTDIAVHYCYKRSTEFRLQNGKTPVQGDYDDACKTLRQIVEGSRTMNDDTGSALQGGVVYTSQGSFIIDTDEGSQSPTGGF